MPAVGTKLYACNVMNKNAGTLLPVGAKGKLLHIAVWLEAKGHKEPAEDIRSMLSAAPAAPAGVPDGWIQGVPPHPWDKEWFIATTKAGERVVLTALPEGWTYDYKTADETYIAASNIECWMQFPDSEFVPYIATTAPAAPADDKWDLVRRAVSMAVERCKSATGMHKQIDQFVNGNQITHDVLGTDGYAPADAVAKDVDGIGRLRHALLLANSIFRFDKIGACEERDVLLAALSSAMAASREGA